jgi:WD40 repeat protein
MSLVRKQFVCQMPDWITGLPKMQKEWSSVLQTLEGHSDSVNAVAFSHDGQLLASASDDRTVRLWNPATGKQLQELELNIVISELCFSMDSACLMTGRGVLRLHSDLLTVSSLEPKSGGDIFYNGGWITRNGRNLLWLPHDHRGECSALKDNILAIGQKSGQVAFIEFSS